MTELRHLLAAKPQGVPGKRREHLHILCRGVEGPGVLVLADVPPVLIGLGDQDVAFPGLDGHQATVLRRVLKFMEHLHVLHVPASRPLRSYGLDIDEVAMLGPLPQGLDPLQFSSVKGEARPGRQLEQGTGDRHEHHHVEAAQAERRSPRARGRVRHRNKRVLHRSQVPMSGANVWPGLVNKATIPKRSAEVACCRRLTT
ncbi:hypothetical protein EYF80_004883 [Liparis tanakae]|uniref:Uncharacterized protein n=1 Tax=Liparis tanakae TaxID=230148 RepID=A0A4Z2J574_9TELE|nr:hypothetical protein EYF80_004883 [Liparis tanakae]